jgi:hypothetical protein
MNRSQYIQSLCEEFRIAYQVLCTPDEDGVTVRFNDDHLGNPDLKFPQVHISTEDFFKIIPHNALTTETYKNALARNETYGIFIDRIAVSRLARRAVPNTQAKYQHTLNRQNQTTNDFNRDGIMSGRV